MECVEVVSVIIISSNNMDGIYPLSSMYTPRPSPKGFTCLTYLIFEISLEPGATAIFIWETGKWRSREV